MFLSPMLLQKSDTPFNDPDSIAELKLDGIRLLYSHMEAKRLFTRHNNDVSNRFPELMALSVPQGTVLDGELIMTDDEGRPDFEKVMSRFSVTNQIRVEQLAETEPVHFCVFDILKYKGKDVTNLPLLERKALLEKVVTDSQIISKVQYMDGEHGEQLFQLCKERELEGVVMKKKDSRYEIDTRSWSWKKVIAYKQAEVYLMGYRKKEMGWFLGKEKGGRIVPAGVLEFGPSMDERKAFYQISKQIKVSETKDAVFIEPNRLKCEIKFRGYTSKGLIRIPVFERFVV